MASAAALVCDIRGEIDLLLNGFFVDADTAHDVRYWHLADIAEQPINVWKFARS
jgi:hypothetical protein